MRFPVESGVSFSEPENIVEAADESEGGNDQSDEADGGDDEGDDENEGGKEEEEQAETEEEKEEGTDTDADDTGPNEREDVQGIGCSGATRSIPTRCL